MRAGQLDRLIEIQKSVLENDDYGQAKEVWSTLCKVWAQVVPLRGEERFAAQQTAAAAEVKFKIRYRKGIGTMNRIVYEGREYDITGVLELGRREGLELLAKTRGEQLTK